MIYSHEVEQMCTVAQGVNHGAAPIPEEAKWVKAKDVTDISGLTHGIGWCAPQQGACKLTLNVKEGLIEEALIETYQRFGIRFAVEPKAVLAFEFDAAHTNALFISVDIIPLQIFHENAQMIEVRIIGRP